MTAFQGDALVGVPSLMPTEEVPLPPLDEWIANAAAQMQRDAVRQAEEAGAVSLRYVGVTFEPDGNGGYTMNGEWEMGVPRG
ncbi:hypothetical protein [Streptomyces drozdowiczii]|uniref:Uncharacterized protein n=1 Tax=Streptomyces drozdowiczii TaxID=202862 RepID=A0ABY6PQP1_9ACTN|nr:hypothetical protein [Streptomyces drozdowiczii]MCX0246418.1 hypothetical protein [Streptomyces drozdowiczii]UZK54079.1 hypothetical protein NEH16_07865 [Streptomyces drozdowiczii]